MDKRRGPRIRSLLQAKVIYNDGQASLDCLIRNQSLGGMRLAISQAVLLPDQFDLHIPKRREIRRVRLIWRGTDEIGVAVIPNSETRVDARVMAAPRVMSIREVDGEIARMEQALNALKAQREAMQAALEREGRAEADEPTLPVYPAVERFDPVDIFDEVTGEWVRAPQAPARRQTG